VELWRQLNVGNWTEDQPIREVAQQTLGGSESKLWIVLANIEGTEVSTTQATAR
jgi:hypothetical protein